MRILWRHLAGLYLKAFAASLGAVLSIYLVVDYVDRAKMYQGDGWLSAVLRLYAGKAVVLGHQLAPAAMLLAAGIVLAGLRQRGEYTALRALAVGPGQLLAPMAVSGLLLASGLVLLDEYAVGRASRSVDEITTLRFKHWGDWRTFFGETRWFRGEQHLYHLRRGGADRGFEDVTLYELSDDFRLSRRIDARAMRPLGGHDWLLEDGSSRVFAGAASRFERFETREVRLREDPRAFRIAKGRPEQMPFSELGEQIDLRARVGLPADRWRMALHNRFAAPLAGVPGAMLAGALALRPGRRGHLASAIAEGFVIVVGLWALLVVCKAAALAGYLSPAAAAWLPVGLLSVAAGAAFRRFAR